MPRNSAAFMYLSRATRSSMRRMILTVVSTPTSEVMSTSSKSSSTSASTVERPATARASFEKRPVLVRSSPAFNSSRRCSGCASTAAPAAVSAGVSCFFLNRSKNPITKSVLAGRRADSCTAASHHGSAPPAFILATKIITIRKISYICKAYNRGSDPQRRCRTVRTAAGTSHRQTAKPPRKARRMQKTVENQM